MLQHFLTILLSKSAVRKFHTDYENRQQERPGTLRPPVCIFLLGAVTMVFCVALLAAVLFSTREPATLAACAVIFGSLFALGLFLVLYERNFMVIYRDGDIIYRNLFRFTRRYRCGEITHAYYTDGGGVKILFQDGRKLKFSREESTFYREILKKERIKCRFEGEESPSIRVSLHPFFLYPFWTVSIGMAVGAFWYPSLFLFAGLMLATCLGCQLSDTTYDKKSRILTRRKCGFSRKFDMSVCSAKPVYQEGSLMWIEIYEKKKRVAKVPVSLEYRNRGRLAKALCRIML